MSRLRVAYLMMTAVLASAAGCGGGPQAPGPALSRAAPASLRIEPAWTSCAADGPARRGSDDVGRLPRLDDSFQPVAAVVCAPAARPRLGGGADPAATESRADDVTALVAALRLPDEPLSGNPCTAELYLPPFFVLLDARGRWVRPGLPSDACGKVRIEVREALQGLRLTATSARPPAQSESSEAAAAGCSRQWADMIWVTGGWGGTSGEAAVIPPGLDGPVQARLCVYRVPVEQQRTGKPAGEFVSGRYLSDAQWARVRRGFESAASAPPCTTPAGRFAVVHIGAGELYVELDGCRRLLAPAADGRQTLRHAAPELIALLTDR